MKRALSQSELYGEAIRAARLARGYDAHVDGLAWAAIHRAGLPPGDIEINGFGKVKVVKADGAIWRHSLTMADRYSENTEHAGTAVPEGFKWRVTDNGFAELWNPDVNIRWHAHGATPALGILLAALELRQRLLL